MAFVAPLAGAALGGLLTGWAGWGLSVGWLVGSWLFGPKAEYENQVFDPGAEEMPTFNQALRGSTIPIMFGTNRVSCQVVWQNNFTTIRHESKKGGGGGKGGGSGMGNKGGGPETTNVTYEYKWDLMFNLGMVGETNNLFGGWLATERLNDATLASILDNSGSYTSFFRSATDRPNNAELSFEEGFFHGGNNTADVLQDGWAHFESVTGGPYRFPSTVYIGFKQLNLGSSARVPQMSFEIGPGEISLTTDSEFYGTISNNTTITDDAGHGPNGDIIKGSDGTLYMRVGSVIGEDDTGSWPLFQELMKLSDNSVSDYMTKERMFNDTSAWTTLVLGAYTDYNLGGCAGTIADKNLAIFAMSGQTAAVTLEWVFAIYSVDANGLYSYEGGFVTRTNNLAWPGKIPTFQVYGLAEDDDPVIMISDVTISSYNSFGLWSLPSINTMKAKTLNEYAATTNPLGDRSSLFNGTITDMVGDDYQTYLPQYGVNGVLKTNMGNVLPAINISSLGLPIIESVIHWHLNSDVMRYTVDNYPSATGSSFFVYSLSADYPVGAILEFNLYKSASSGFVTLADSWTVVNCKYLDTGGNIIAPFSGDDAFDRDGNLNVYWAYHPIWQIQKLTTGVAAGATLIGMWKYSSVAQSLSNTNYQYFSPRLTYTKFMGFIWNPIAQTATRYFQQETDVGSYQFYTGGLTMGEYQASGYFNETDSTIYRTSFAGSLDDHKVAVIGSINIGGGEDVTPPYIIYQVLTSEIFGMNYTADDIDLPSYQLAVQYCEAQNIKISVQYRREESTLGIIDELLTVYGGFLTDSGGKIRFGLQEYTSSPIRTIDNDNLRIEKDGEAPVKITKGARQDTYNKVKVNYFDRDLEYRQNFIEIADEVDMDINGVRAQEYPAKFVMSEATANKIAVRALWGNLYARDIYEFMLGPKDADLEPGDVITLVDSFNQNLSAGKQVRIVEWQETQPLLFRVRAVDEIEYINNGSVDASSSTEAPDKNTLFGPAAPPAYTSMYELPKEFQGADAKLFVGYRQQNAAMGARLYLSADGVSYSQMDDIQPFIISGIMAEGLPNRDVGYVEENVEVYLMPDTRSSAFNPSTPTYCQTFALEDASENTRALGASAIWINSEMMAYEGVNLLAQNHYRFDRLYRGWGGTHIQAHNSGDTWWRQGGGVFLQTLNADKVGNLIYYKVQPYNFAGVGYNISSIEARTYQVQGTYWRPQNPGALRTYVQSPGSYVTIQSEDLNFITKKQVVAGGSPVQIEWPDTSRDSGYGALGYDYLTYGGFAADTTSHQYRVQVYSSDGTTVVRCTTVSTLAFLYTVDANSTDFNGWAGSFQVKVTPYNTLGDSLRSRTKILELFE